MVRSSVNNSFNRPKYLAPFKYEKVPNMKEKLEAVKSGSYNLEKEELELNSIIKELSSKQKSVHSRISTLGLLKFSNKQVSPELTMLDDTFSKSSMLTNRQINGMKRSSTQRS
jgi:hypothetical protein